MFVGRERELARLADLVFAARGGRSGALVLSGEPGIGKTSLLQAAAEMADGMQVLSARGVSSESELPFAGLTEVFAGMGAVLAVLPDRQRLAMEGALGIRHSTSVDPFTVGVATLGLMAAIAERGPVLCIVDDLQWLDASSTEALTFAARRLQAEGVAVLFAVRTGDDVGGTTADLETIVLEGLSLSAAEQVLSAVAATFVEPDVARSLYRATGGNPLALVELPGLLSSEQLGGWVPLDDPLPPGPITDRAFRQRIAGLSADSRTALLVVAATGTGELDLVLAALRDLGVEPAALEEAEEARIITEDHDRVEFRHPLLRAGAYYAAMAPGRRRAHAAVARALDTSDGRRAWQLAAASVAPDTTVADALEDAAVEARQRGAHATAARALQRAAQLTPDADIRARRLGEASGDLNMIGRPRAGVELATEALRHVRSAVLHADLELVRSSLLMVIGRPQEAHETLMLEAAKFEEAAPDRAAALQLTAVGPCYLVGDGLLAYRTAERAHRNACRVGGPLEVFAGAVLAQTLVIRGDANRARPLLEACLPYLMEADPVWGPHLAMAPAVCMSYLWIEQFTTARTLVARFIDAARVAGAPGLLPFPLSVLAEIDVRSGAWDEAYSGLYEAVELARQTGQAVHLPRLLSGLARIEAQRGDEAGCRAHTTESTELGIELGETRSAQMNADEVLGLLEFAKARHGAALTHLDRLGRALAAQEVGEPSLMGAAPERIEALTRVGRREEAVGALAVLSGHAEMTGSRWGAAVVERCKGVISGAEAAGQHFDAALHLHEQVAMPFERARTELCFGEALRRSKRRREAREQLGRALDTFGRLGARPWIARAEHELAATGLSARRRDPGAAVELTPQELRVALTVAEGASNREAAAALFLSTKTIEFHLGSIYRKLNVRSRSDLARFYASQRFD